VTEVPLITNRVGVGIVNEWARELGKSSWWDQMHTRGNNRPEFMYFARSPSGRVKVGWSKDPIQRARYFRNGGERFTLVAAILGCCFVDESSFHRRWRHLRTTQRSEIYPPGPVSDLMARLAASADAALLPRKKAA
jgi:hypothetical protein